MADATGGKQIEKAASLKTKKHSQTAPRATLSAVADWQRNRWAWKRAVLADRRLADCAKLLATGLVGTFAHCETGRCNPSNETLAETLGKDVRNIRRAVAERRAAGWIDTRTGRGRGARIAFIFLTGGGSVPIADPRKVTEMATYRTEQARDKRTDVSAYPAESRTPETVENPERRTHLSMHFMEPKKNPIRAHTRGRPNVIFLTNQSQPDTARFRSAGLCIEAPAPRPIGMAGLQIEACQTFRKSACAHPIERGRGSVCLGNSHHLRTILSARNRPRGSHFGW